MRWEGRQRSVRALQREEGQRSREEEGDEDHRDRVGEDESNFWKGKKERSKRVDEKVEGKRTLCGERTKETLAELSGTVAATVEPKKNQFRRQRGEKEGRRRRTE